MSTGPVKPFIDYSENTGGDTGQTNAASIEPYLDGEYVNQTVLQRPPENLRQRTENVRSVFDDVLYSMDADRALAIGGPGTVSWPGIGTGTFTISDTLYIMPFLTMGDGATVNPVPPTTHSFGTLYLQSTSSAYAITVQCLRRAYDAGAKLNITVVTGGAAGSVSVALSDTPERTVVITANAPTLGNVITALNAVLADTVDGPDSQLMYASLYPPALAADILLTPQSKQYVTVPSDGESHALTPAALAAFFAIPSNRLIEGSTLCFRYADMVEEGGGKGGRRQSIPLNSNTTMPAGSLFISELAPYYLVNAIPICKVINGGLIFINGQTIPAGSTGVPIGGVGVATPTQLGLVKLSYAAGTPAAPEVVALQASGKVGAAITGTTLGSATGNNAAVAGIGDTGINGGLFVGGTGAAGVVGSGGTGSSAVGVAGYGTGVQPGVQGVAGTGTNASGVVGLGQGTGAGVRGTGGTTGAGGEFIGSVTAPAIYSNGQINFSATAPAAGLPSTAYAALYVTNNGGVAGVSYRQQLAVKWGDGSVTIIAESPVI